MRTVSANNFDAGNRVGRRFGGQRDMATYSGLGANPPTVYLRGFDTPLMAPGTAQAVMAQQQQQRMARLQSRRNPDGIGMAGSSSVTPNDTLRAELMRIANQRTGLEGGNNDPFRLAQSPTLAENILASAQPKEEPASAIAPARADNPLSLIANGFQVLGGMPGKISLAQLLGGKQAEGEDMSKAYKADPENATEKQRKAGNYSKGHVRVAGLNITIEQTPGSKRSGKDHEGKSWEHTYRDFYGYVRLTEGNDGAHVDVYLKKGAGDYSKVFVIDQDKVDDTGGFDEHKCMLGYGSEDEAKSAYLNHYQTGWKGFGGITEMPLADFKKWLFRDGSRKRPLSTKKNKEQTMTRFLSQKDAAGVPPAAQAALSKYTANFLNALNILGQKGSKVALVNAPAPAVAAATVSGPGKLANIGGYTAMGLGAIKATAGGDLMGGLELGALGVASRGYGAYKNRKPAKQPEQAKWGDTPLTVERTPAVAPMAAVNTEFAPVGRAPVKVPPAAAAQPLPVLPKPVQSIVGDAPTYDFRQL